MRIFSRFNQKGFTLVEVMVVAGMVAGLSLAIMQMTKNASKSVKKMSQDMEINEKLNEIRNALKESTGCTATFTTPGFSLTGTGFTTGLVVPNIRKVVGSSPGVPVVVATTTAGSNEYANGTSGAFTITEMKLAGFVSSLPGVVPVTYDRDTTLEPPTASITTTVAPTARRQGTAILRITFTKGHFNSALNQNDVSYGGATITKDISLSMIVNDVTKAILSCASDNESYVKAACEALGGVINGSLCVGIDVAATGTVPGTIDNANVPATFQTNTSDAIVRIINQTAGGGTKEIVATGTGSTTGAGKLTFGTTASKQMVIDSTGLVGIGTFNPVSILEVRSTGIENAQFTLPAGNTRIRLGRPGTLADDNGIIGWDDTLKQLQFYISGETAGAALNIANGGNVGIGTTAPAGSLHIDGPGDANAELKVTDSAATGIELRSTGNSATYIDFARNSTSSTGVGAPADFNGRISYNETGANDMRFYTNATERVEINSAGNVGIGVAATATNQIEVAGNMNTLADITAIGGVSTDPRRFVTKEWVTAALSGTLASTWTTAQRDVMMQHLLNYVASAYGAGHYTTLKDAILATIEVQTGVLVPGPASSTATCAGATVAKQLQYQASTGTFRLVCGAETNPPDCTVSGNCTQLCIGTRCVSSATNFRTRSCVQVTGLTPVCSANRVVVAVASEYPSGSGWDNELKITCCNVNW
jgi:prepilin-type N-terminal cleavage/methylation domain-containing protein